MIIIFIIFPGYSLIGRVDCDLATIQLQWLVETVELPGRGKDKSTIRDTYDTLKERQLSLGR